MHRREPAEFPGRRAAHLCQTLAASCVSTAHQKPRPHSTARSACSRSLQVRDGAPPCSMGSRLLVAILFSKSRCDVQNTFATIGTGRASSAPQPQRRCLLSSALQTRTVTPNFGSGSIEFCEYKMRDAAQEPHCEGCPNPVIIATLASPNHLNRVSRGEGSSGRPRPAASARRSATSIRAGRYSVPATSLLPC